MKRDDVLAWTIKWQEQALNEVAALPIAVRRRIFAAVERLAENPLIGKALKGKWQGLRRARIGDYRVVYSIERDELLILILRVAPRKDVYR